MSIIEKAVARFSRSDATRATPARAVAGDRAPNPLDVPTELNRPAMPETPRRSVEPARPTVEPRRSLSDATRLKAQETRPLARGANIPDETLPAALAAAIADSRSGFDPFVAEDDGRTANDGAVFRRREAAAEKSTLREPVSSPAAAPAPNRAAGAGAGSTAGGGGGERDPAARSRYIEIDLKRLAAAGMITPESGKTLLAEEFRLIKRPLLMNALNQGAAPIKNGNLIMVTSSLPGEGKSYTSINLAMSIAMELDHRVLLVDADVAKPSLPDYLGIEVDRGLMDVLLDTNLSLADVMMRTNVEKLTILPAGRGHRYATELLASDSMTRLLQEMATRYHDRIIIFDSPPLLVTTESRVLATRMGQVLMVVEAGKTTREGLSEAINHLGGCDVVGLILNKGDTVGSGYYGYGGYGT